jgi:hypothetical protein
MYWRVDPLPWRPFYLLPQSPNSPLGSLESSPSEEEEPEHQADEEHHHDGREKEEFDVAQHGLTLQLAHRLVNTRSGDDENAIICIAFRYLPPLLQIRCYRALLHRSLSRLPLSRVFRGLLLSLPFRSASLGCSGALAIVEENGLEEILVGVCRLLGKIVSVDVLYPSSSPTLLLGVLSASR